VNEKEFQMFQKYLKHLMTLSLSSESNLLADNSTQAGASTGQLATRKPVQAPASLLQVT